VNESRLAGTLRVVGAGLIGTSLGLALRKKDLDVVIVDSSPAVQALAIDFGAGRAPEATDQPILTIVCVPPDVAARVIDMELKAYSKTTITDVASVKAPVIRELVDMGADISRYVGSHPMAGREQAGTLSGRADIFTGRPWVICPNESSTQESISLVESLALDLGASVVRMSATEHDRAVALVSHAPQLVSSLLASRLKNAEDKDISLAGQGLRDTTRIAASDPKLWMQILAQNNVEVAAVIRNLKQDLDQVLNSLEEIDRSGSLASIGKLLESGNLGVAKIPGKHGSGATSYAKVIVMIDDRPGELARLLTEVGEIGINLEDLKLEHGAGAPVGLPELFVLPELEEKLVEALRLRNWRVV
jgi:prephenate dehydrogenase